MKVQSDLLGKFFGRVHLGGAIQECVLEIKNKRGYIQAVDMTNTILAFCSEELSDFEDMKIGLSNLSILHRFFSGETEEKIDLQFSKEGNHLILKKGRSGQIKLLLLVPEHVPTALEDPGAKEKLLDNDFSIIDFPAKRAEDFLYYSELIGSKSALFRINDGACYLENGKNEVNRYKLSFGKIDSEDFSVHVYGDFLKSIVKVLSWEEKDTAPKILLAKERPVIIKQDEENMWALAPAEGM
jgi:hypothetical protein